MDTLTMNIKRKWFAEIIEGTKVIEYRRMSPFWKRRIDPLKPPFKLRLLNGMLRPIPEAEVVVTKVVRTRSPKEYQLHLGKVLRVRRWNRAARKPKR